jgi:hypothetical protein
LKEEKIWVVLALFTNFEGKRGGKKGKLFYKCVQAADTE